MKTLKAIELIVLTCVSVEAQWVKVPAAAIPRTSDGKPNLSAPAPRMADGKPDLSGVWEPNGKYVQNLAADLKPDEVHFSVGHRRCTTNVKPARIRRTTRPRTACLKVYRGSTP